MAKACIALLDFYHFRTLFQTKFVTSYSKMAFENIKKILTNLPLNSFLPKMLFLKS